MGLRNTLTEIIDAENTAALELRRQIDAAFPLPGPHIGDADPLAQAKREAIVAQIEAQTSKTREDIMELLYSDFNGGCGGGCNGGVDVESNHPEADSNVNDGYTGGCNGGYVTPSKFQM